MRLLILFVLAIAAGPPACDVEECIEPTIFFDPDLHCSEG